MSPRAPRFLLAAALWACPVSAQAPPPDTARPAPRTIPELEARIREILESTRTPGIGLTLVSRDHVLYAEGLGLANRAAGRPATGKTLFRIGSTSKAFAALSVLMLQEEGKLTLTDPIRQHIPEIWFQNPWEATDPVRIVNLLEHTSGFDDNSLKGYANNDPTPLTLRQGIDLDARTHVSRWRPGTRVSYCNTGPAIAAYIVEKLETKPFEQVVQERLFDPLGMSTATYLLPDTTRLPLATLYKADGTTEEAYWHVFIRPAGSINASAEDMGQYVRFLLNRGAVDGRRLLPAAAIERLERSEASLTAASGLTVGYGLHISRYADSAGFVWTGHDGGVNGGLTNMAYIPELGVGYAFMINSGSGEAYEEISRLLRDYLTRDLMLPALPPRGAMPAEARAVYAGWYRPDNPRMKHLYFIERLFGIARVSVSDTALFVEPAMGDPVSYVPVRGRLFREAREPVATMALTSDSASGRPIAIEVMGYMLPTSLVRIPAVTAWIEILVTVLWIAGALLALLVALVGGIRRIVGILRRRKPGPSVTRPMWRVTSAAVLVLLGSLFVMIKSSGDFSLGKPSITSVGIWLALLLFPLLAAAGVVTCFRRIAPGVARRPVSLMAVRALAILNVIVAGYLIYWGLIGWRTWA
jgi:CubicO group peptidase (beta-lactamase class C family)